MGDDQRHDKDHDRKAEADAEIDPQRGGHCIGQPRRQDDEVVRPRRAGGDNTGDKQAADQRAMHGQ